MDLCWAVMLALQLAAHWAALWDDSKVATRELTMVVYLAGYSVPLWADLMALTSAALMEGRMVVLSGMRWAEHWAGSKAGCWACRWAGCWGEKKAVWWGDSTAGQKAAC